MNGDLPRSLGAYEAAALAEALRRSNDTSLAARHLLGLSKSSFYRKLNKAKAAYPDMYAWWTSPKPKPKPKPKPLMRSFFPNPNSPF